MRASGLSFSMSKTYHGHRRRATRCSSVQTADGQVVKHVYPLPNLGQTLARSLSDPSEPVRKEDRGGHEKRL